MAVIGLHEVTDVTNQSELRAKFFIYFLKLAELAEKNERATFRSPSSRLLVFKLLQYQVFRFLPVHGLVGVVV